MSRVCYPLLSQGHLVTSRGWDLAAIAEDLLAKWPSHDFVSVLESRYFAMSHNPSSKVGPRRMC